MRRLFGLAVSFALATLAGGCDSNNSNKAPPDLSTIWCPAGMKDCVDSTTARICPSDSSGWIAKPCPFGSTCMAGDCSAPNVSAAPCTPGAKVCAGNTVLTCGDTGFGYAVSDCPAGTQCVGAGFCVGACAVGETSCSGNNTLLTCADGFSLTPSPCPTGTLCVTDNTSPGSPGICVKGDCTPDSVNGCNSQCGIQGGPSPSPGATNFVSTCTNTRSPLGWRWLATQCQVGTCDPAGADCNSTTRKQQGACVSQCTPGAVRCNSNGNSNGTQTCDATGNWGAVVACGPGLACGSATGTALCGDSICVTGAVAPQGICADVGGVSQIIACTNGRLAAAPTPCTIGTCIHDASIGGQAGICAVQCQSGDLRCTNGQTQGCAANGLWSSTLTPCASGSCHGFTDVNGRPSAICGACSPGTQNCTDSTHVETCNASGQFDAAVACTIGQCTGNACVAQCVPGSLICLGGIAPSPEPGVPFPGTSAVATCTSNGLIPQYNSDPCLINQAPPTGVACCSSSPGVFAGCRRDPGGNAIGCVVCVGTGQNEVGQIDTRCSNVAGDSAGQAATEICKPTNDGWQAPAACSNPNGCQHPTPSPGPGSNTVPAGFTASCHTNCNSQLCTNSFWSARGSSCNDAGMGGPMSCGNTNDCCAAACYTDNLPTPALCGN